jgi:type III secretory pathway component EscU
MIKRKKKGLDGPPRVGTKRRRGSIAQESKDVMTIPDVHVSSLGGSEGRLFAMRLEVALGRPPFPGDK